LIIRKNIYYNKIDTTFFLHPLPIRKVVKICSFINIFFVQSLRKLGFFGILLLVFSCLRDFLDLVLHAFVEQFRVFAAAVFMDHAVLAKAQQNGVDTHVVDGKDIAGDCEREDTNDNDDRQRSEKRVFARKFRRVAQPQIARDQARNQHHKLAQKHNVLVDHVDGGDLKDIRGDEQHGHGGRLAEVVTIHSHHDVRLASQILETSVEEEEHAVDHFEESFDALVILLGGAGPLLKVHKNETDQLDRGEDEGTNGHRPEVVLHHATIRAANWEGLPHSFVSTRPIPATEGTSHSGERNRIDKSHSPQNHEQVKDLEDWLQVQGAESLRVHDSRVVEQSGTG